MQGSLWLQAIDSDTAMQLTAGPGYDFQPDVSPDGTEVVFVRYLASALEIHRLNIESGETSALTKGGAVNLEPRWSPDGSRLAFVSTRGAGRFHVFVGELSDGQLTAMPVVEERESSIERYYYSSFDHELSPVWAADGQSLFYTTPNPAWFAGKKHHGTQARTLPRTAAELPMRRIWAGNGINSGSLTLTALQNRFR
jgi:dipeptidyl aminopeptidase/acylaminoacyl peptidase